MFEWQEIDYARVLELACVRGGSTDFECHGGGRGLLIGHEANFLGFMF